MCARVPITELFRHSVCSAFFSSFVFIQKALSLFILSGIFSCFPLCYFVSILSEYNLLYTSNIIMILCYFIVTRHVVRNCYTVLFIISLLCFHSSFLFFRSPLSVSRFSCNLNGIRLHCITSVVYVYVLVKCVLVLMRRLFIFG